MSEAAAKSNLRALRRFLEERGLPTAAWNDSELSTIWRLAQLRTWGSSCFVAKHLLPYVEAAQAFALASPG